MDPSRSLAAAGHVRSRNDSSFRYNFYLFGECKEKKSTVSSQIELYFYFLDVVIPTNSPERSSIVLKAGQRVMVLKSPKGIYMQLENGKIIAIRTAFKMGANNKTENKAFATDKDELKKGK